MEMHDLPGYGSLNGAHASGDTATTSVFPFQTQDAVFTIDSRQVVTAWSQAAERLTGYQSREVLGRPCHEVFCGIDTHHGQFCRRHCPSFFKAMTAGAPADYSLFFRTKKGRPVWCTVTMLLPERKTDDLAMVGILREVTHERLGQLRKQIRFLLSHEFKNALTPIKAGIELLEGLEGGRILPEYPPRILASMARSCDRLEGLVDNLLRKVAAQGE